MMKTADIYIFKHAFSNNLIIIELELQKAKMKLRQSFWLVYFNKVADCKQYGGIYLPSLRKHNYTSRCVSQRWSFMYIFCLRQKVKFEYVKCDDYNDDRYQKWQQI
jgi:hypothetical protein